MRAAARFLLRASFGPGQPENLALAQHIPRKPLQHYAYVDKIVVVS